LLQRRAFTIFRVAGIPIRIHASWLAVFGLVTWALVRALPTSELLAEVALGPLAQAALAVATALAFFGSILLHELGHAIPAIRSGVAIRSITLFVFGGLAELEREPDRPWVELKIAVGGPAVSLLLGALGIGLMLLALQAADGPRREAWLAVATALEYVGSANLALLVFNLFPGFPLDGGRILRAAIWRVTGSVRRATRATTAIGGAFGLGLVALAVVEGISQQGSVLHAGWLALIGLFVHRAARASYEHTLIREGLAGVRVEDVMRPGLAPPPGTLGGRRVEPGMGALAALERMREGAGYLLVFEGELFRGLVTRSDIIRAAALRARAA
jgi:Zn-dependent protease